MSVWNPEVHLTHVRAFKFRNAFHLPSAARAADLHPTGDYKLWIILTQEASFSSFGAAFTTETYTKAAFSLVFRDCSLKLLRGTRKEAPPASNYSFPLALALLIYFCFYFSLLPFEFDMKYFCRRVLFLWNYPCCTTFQNTFFFSSVRLQKDSEFTGWKQIMFEKRWCYHNNSGFDSKVPAWFCPPASAAPRNQTIEGNEEAQARHEAA